MQSWWYFNFLAVLSVFLLEFIIESITKLQVVSLQTVDYSLFWRLYPTLCGNYRFFLFFKAIAHLNYFLFLFLQVPPHVFSASKFLTKKVRSLIKRFLNSQLPTYKFLCVHGHTCLCRPRISLCLRCPRSTFSDVSMSSAQCYNAVTYPLLHLQSPPSISTGEHIPLESLLLFSTRIIKTVNVRWIFILFPSLCISFSLPHKMEYEDKLFFKKRSD